MPTPSAAVKPAPESAAARIVWPKVFTTLHVCTLSRRTDPSQESRRHGVIARRADIQLAPGLQPSKEQLSRAPIFGIERAEQEKRHRQPFAGSVRSTIPERRHSKQWYTAGDLCTGRDLPSFAAPCCSLLHYADPARGGEEGVNGSWQAGFRTQYPRTETRTTNLAPTGGIASCGKGLRFRYRNIRCMRGSRSCRNHSRAAGSTQCT
jgi:hypothetical protein